MGGDSESERKCVGGREKTARARESESEKERMRKREKESKKERARERERGARARARAENMLKIWLCARGCHLSLREQNDWKQYTRKIAGDEGKCCD